MTTAQEPARFALRKYWGPVAAEVMAEPEVLHVLTHLMSGQDGGQAARTIDGHIQRMSGVSGVRIVENALDATGVPA